MTIPNSVSVADQKSALRRLALAKRKETHGLRKHDAAKAVCRRLVAEVAPKNKIIAGYWPLGDELDCRPVLEALKAHGADVALPVVAGQGQVLIFRAWRPGDTLDPGPFGTAHPGLRAPVVAPTILLLPLVAFDGTGHRLGYGAGYYDRTVARLRTERSVMAIGIAYDEQEVEAVPTDGHDQRMDAVMTDRRTIWFNESMKP